MDDNEITLELNAFEAGHVIDGLAKLERHWRESAEEHDLPLHQHRANACRNIINRIHHRFSELHDETGDA